MSQLSAYKTSNVPQPFGFNNTGVICYANSLLQSLLSCSSFVRAVLNNKEIFDTRTGLAIYYLVEASINGEDCRSRSSTIVECLILDMQGSNTRFGRGQECATEMLVHVLDNISQHASKNVIHRLFKNRYRRTFHCSACQESTKLDGCDEAYNLDLFYMDGVSTDEEFNKLITRHTVDITDFICPKCEVQTKKSYMTYVLTMLPEIIYCAFNLFTEYGGSRKIRIIPETLKFPEIDGGEMMFKKIAQIEHSGSMHGGHYWSKCLRNDEKIYKINDNSYSLSTMDSNENIYIVVYHYVGLSIHQID